MNLDGTKKLFEEIKGITNSIIYISGLGVYGETGDKIIDETPKYIIQIQILLKSD